MKVLLAHPGTQHSFPLAAELHRRNLLYEFWTCFALAKNSARSKLAGFAPAVIRDRIENRLVDLSASKLRTLPALEREARRQQSLGVEPETVNQERNQRFQEMILQPSIESADVVIGFDTSSWVLVDRARRAGKRFILDQTTAHPKAGREAWTRAGAGFPGWSEAAPTAVESVLENQRAEHEQADLIVTASSFTRDSLIANGVASDKIQANPYGVDLDRFHPASTLDSSCPIRFIFVGGLTARKGVPLLVAAWKKLKPKGAELWLVGDVSEHVRRLIPDLPGLKILGRKSRGQLPDLLRSCNVFVFPSYFEGFGLVLLEAMASGLPIIGTEATAAPDLIDGTNAGKLIKSGDVDELMGAMKHFIDRPEEVERMSKAARARAEEFSWKSYGDRWERMLNGLTTDHKTMDHRPPTSDF